MPTFSSFNPLGSDIQGGEIVIPSEAQGDLLIRGASGWERLAIGAAGKSLRVNSGATAPEWTAGGVWEEISDTELGSSVASVSFSSIPSGYRLLKLIAIIVPSVDGDWIDATFNSDTGNNYESRNTRSSSTTANSTSQTATAFAQMGICCNPTAFSCEIVNIASLKKVFVGNSGGDAQNAHFTGAWNNTSDEISDITLTANSGTYGTGSRFFLLGLV